MAGNGDMRADDYDDGLLFSIPINLYPIMLQRYNRIKLQELIDGLGQSVLPGEPARG